MMPTSTKSPGGMVYGMGLNLEEAKAGALRIRSKLRDHFCLLRA